MIARSLAVNRALLIGGLLLQASVASAQPAIRHEYVPPEFFADLPTFDQALHVSAPLPGDSVPSGIARNGQTVDAPPSAEPPAPPPKPDSILRPERVRPDRQTSQDSALEYHSLFNPEVAPLRRNVVFNEVGPAPDYELSIRPGPLQTVPVLGTGGGAPGPGREAFYGDVTLDLRAGQTAPLPSVAPDMRFLALRTEPLTRVTVLRDEADNFYARAEVSGPVRLVFFVDADAKYFSGSLPEHVPLGSGAAHPDAQLEAAVRGRAAKVLGQLGVAPDDPLRRGLEGLVRHFRSFVGGELPAGADGADLYLELALGGVGVCRHRAFAFLVTARAAGVPTRFVQNEAHAFAEVGLPDGSWRRVDLGGEAPRLDVKSDGTTRLHVPAPDAFPKPLSYEESYSKSLLSGRSKNDASGVPLMPFGAGASRMARRAEVPLPSSLSGSPPMPFGADAGGLPDLSGLEGLQSLRPPEAAKVGRRVRLELEGQAGRLEVFRGDALPFEAKGALTDDEGGAVADVTVQVFLVPMKIDGGLAVAAGKPVRTGSSGTFRARLKLSQTMPLGRYRLVAASKAEHGYAASRSDETR